MANQHVYLDILAKIDRADKHISDLESLWVAAQKDCPNRTRIERDPQSGDVTYYVADITPIPAEVALIAGDALQNLRSTLDHLVWAMMKKTGAKPSTQTAFPIFDCAADYADPRRGAARKIAGLHSLAIQEIDRLQPYKGGNDKLWYLHRLNNIDKHRLLLTVGHYIAASTLMPSERRKYTAVLRLGYPGADAPSFNGLFMNFSQPNTFAPAEINQKICTIPAQDADENMEFVFDIALNETGILRGISLTLVLKFISSEVRMIVGNMGRFL